MNPIYFRLYLYRFQTVVPVHRVRCTSLRAMSEVGATLLFEKAYGVHRLSGFYIL